MVTFWYYNQVILNGVKVHSYVFWNNDGIDIVDSSNVTIRNSDVSAADDGICLKSHHLSIGCNNIIIENCRVKSSASAIKFGTASFGGFKNVRINNIEIYDTHRSAIALGAVDGGAIENVTVSKICATNTWNAIFAIVGKRCVNGIRMDNVKLTLDEKDYRHAFIFDKCGNVSMSGMSVYGDNKIPVLLNQVDGYRIHNVNGPGAPNDKLVELFNID